MAKKQTKQLTIMGVAAPIALVAGLALAPQSWAADKAYVMDAGSKDAVTTGYGECWTTSGEPNPMEKCGDVLAQPVAAPDPCAGDADGDGISDCNDKCANTPGGAKVDANGCEIVQSLTINLDVDEFAFDSATLKPEMEAALEELAGRIKASKGDESLMIIGHTDSTGPADYNLGLSVRRAESVATFLEGQGISATRMSIKGVGEEQPIASNATREGRAQNRRVEIQTQ